MLRRAFWFVCVNKPVNEHVNLNVFYLLKTVVYL